MRVASAWIPVALVIATACASARVVSAPAPVPATRSTIRFAVRSDPSRFSVGRMISLDAGTLALERFVAGVRAHWVTDRIPTDSIAQLQVRIGRRSNAGRGALIGGGVGVALGLLCAASYNENEWFSPTPGQCLVSGAVSGAGIGVLIGALARSDVWAPVPLPTRGPSESPSPPVTAAAEIDTGAAQ